MQELRKEIIRALNSVNQSWADEITKAEKEERGLDLLQINPKFSLIMTELMIKLDEFSTRSTTKKKGMW